MVDTVVNCDFESARATLWQTVLVCPSCPAEKAWIVTLDVAKTTIFECFGDEMNYTSHMIVLPVRCGSCRRRRSIGLLEGQVCSVDHDVDLSFTVFGMHCYEFCESLNLILKKSICIPRIYVRRTYYTVPCFSFESLMRCIVIDKEVYLLQDRLHITCSEMLCSFFTASWED
jgi:hypothetical protein